MGGFCPLCQTPTKNHYIMSGLVPAAEVHVGKPGSGIWRPLEGSGSSLPAAGTGECETSHSCGTCPREALKQACVCVQVGIVSVALCAPTVEGSYTSHWRLAHAGEQFGPRVWCSIVVDPLAPAPMMADGILVSPCVTPQVERMQFREAEII